jgi:serine/threonine protein kinase
MPQPVRFLARVLSRHLPDADSAGTVIVLATPLYVELDDQPPASQPASVPQVAVPDPPVPLPSSQPGSAAASASGEPRSIGPYKVVRRLGEGAMGVVYQVSDSDGRDLALKVIRPKYAQDAAFLQRFAAEADTARQVRDASVAGVIDAAVNTEMPYLVAEFTEGPTIEEGVSRDGPLPTGDGLRVGIGIATALAAIHGAGFIHRDLTPSNVILSPGGPKVIDFGVARPAASGRDPRAERLRIGTPAYMSPEQVQHEELTPASDVFSWASIMVYATTGHQAFGRTSRVGVFWEIQEDEPDLTDVPAGLREIISAAFAKDPAARPSAGELIQRLRAIGQPQPSPPAGYIRRHRVGIFIAAAVLIAASAATVPVLTSDGSGSALSTSKRASSPVLQAPATGSLITGLKNPEPIPTTVIFSPDGKSLAVGSTSNGTKSSADVWDLATRKVTAALTVPGNPAMVSLAYSPSGRVLAASAGDGIYLWSTVTYKAIFYLSYALDPDPSSVAYAPSGSAVAEAATSIYLWDTATDQITAVFPNPVSDVSFNEAAYAPSGRVLAADENGTEVSSGDTYLWNVASHKLIATLPAPAGQSFIGPIAWSPSGQLLAIGGGFGYGDADTYLWNTITHKLIAVLADPKGLEVNDLAWAPGGQVLATSDQNGSVYLWDVATGKITATLTDHKSQGAYSVAFSPDATVLAVGDGNGYTYLWRIRTRKDTSAGDPRR